MREEAEILTALFPTPGRRGDGRAQRDACVPAARGCVNSRDHREETVCGVVSAWRSGWLEHRGAVRRTQLLPPAAIDRDSSAPARRRGCCDRSRWILRTASEL